MAKVERVTVRVVVEVEMRDDDGGYGCEGRGGATTTPMGEWEPEVAGAAPAAVSQRAVEAAWADLPRHVREAVAAYQPAWLQEPAAPGGVG